MCFLAIEMRFLSQAQNWKASAHIFLFKVKGWQRILKESESGTKKFTLMLSNSALDFNVSLQQTENSCDILKEMGNILPHFSPSKNCVLKQTSIQDWQWHTTIMKTFL
jgi:hypothetical protein